jgi:hypothetical protein
MSQVSGTVDDCGHQRRKKLRQYETNPRQAAKQQQTLLPTVNVQAQCMVKTEKRRVKGEGTEKRLERLKTLKGRSKI